MRPEEKIEKRFVSKVEKLGCYAPKWEIAGKKGAHDRMVFIPGGEILFIEFKRPGLEDGRSFHQIEFDKKIRNLGQRTYLFDNWEQPLKIVKFMLEQLNEIVR